MSEYSGNAKNFYKPSINRYTPLPTEKQKNLEEWKKESNKRLEGTGEVVTSSFWHGFFIFFTILFFISWLILGIVFVNYVGDGAFKTDINQKITSFFNQTTNNNYEFKPDTKNDFDNDFNLTANILINVYTNSS